jgi:chromatin segregation and condensation protein Rec8/ScpA/Scc1 (kleisin family)
MEWYVGHLDRYPEFRTQAKTLDELERRLQTFYTSLQKTNPSDNRRHGRLDVA